MTAFCILLISTFANDTSLQTRCTRKNHAHTFHNIKLYVWDENSSYEDSHCDFHHCPSWQNEAVTKENQSPSMEWNAVGCKTLWSRLLFYTINGLISCQWQDYQSRANQANGAFFPLTRHFGLPINPKIEALQLICKYGVSTCNTFVHDLQIMLWHK